MGNYMSCNISPLIKAAKVILPGGEVRQFREPIKAAEIMLEYPNYFLVNSNGLNIGRRFSFLSADEDLEFGNLYIMFPMRRVNSIVTPDDMVMVLTGANSAATKQLSGRGDVRISPVVGVEMEAPASSTGAIEMENVGIFPGGGYNCGLSVCRSRRPSLDTIFEEPVPCLKVRAQDQESLRSNSIRYRDGNNII